MLDERAEPVSANELSAGRQGGVGAYPVQGGCAVSRTVYVKERDKVTALRPGETYSNATEAVEWVVPRTVMTQLVIASEKL